MRQVLKLIVFSIGAITFISGLGLISFAFNLKPEMITLNDGPLNQLEYQLAYLVLGYFLMAPTVIWLTPKLLFWMLASSSKPSHPDEP